MNLSLAFNKGFVKAAMDNGLNIYTAVELLKHSGIADSLGQGLQKSLHQPGGLGAGGLAGAGAGALGSLSGLAPGVPGLTGGGFMQVLSRLAQHPTGPGMAALTGAHSLSGLAPGPAVYPAQ